jgi:hypothetical protein
MGLLALIGNGIGFAYTHYRAYLRAAYGPQSKGVGQWQLKRAMQGEFAAKKYYEIILDHFSTELGRRGGHELLTLLAAHASKRMDG